MTINGRVKNLTWIRRLEPFPHESLSSFLARWARANVLTSRSELLTTLDISRAIRILPIDLEKLALSLEIDLSILNDIAPANEAKRPVLRRGHTRPTTEAVCPHCLNDESYSHQLWSHCLATACPTHGIRLVDHCQHCGNGLRHDRPLAHLCECGADLRKHSTEPATAAEVEFCTLLTGAMPVITTLPFNLDKGIPPELDLFVLGLTNHFEIVSGNNPRVKAGKTALPKNVNQAIARLAPIFDLFDCWPNAFDKQLKVMMEAAPAVKSTGVAARLGRWYYFLFRKYSQEAFEPFRVAAANRIVQSHDGLLNARTHSVQAIATVQKNWFSVKEAALELSVTAERINDGIDRHLIFARVHDEAIGYRQRFLDRQEIDRLKQLQFEHIDDTAAQEILQVPKAVYVLMCDAGWLPRADIHDIAPIVSGYIKHVPLLGLIETLRTSAMANSGRRWGTFVRLRDLNLRRTTDLQRLIDLFRSIATGELKPIGHDESLSIGGLMFSQTEIDKRIASWFVARGLTLQQISALMGAHYDAVKAWVELGLLPATREPMEQGAPWVVDLQDFTTFLQTYASLAWQAKAIDSTSRGLATRLQLLGINPIEPEGGRGALVRLPDIFGALKKAPSATAQ